MHWCAATHATPHALLQRSRTPHPARRIDFANLTVFQLGLLCENAGLPKSGLKADLVKRLVRVWPRFARTEATGTHSIASRVHAYARACTYALDRLFFRLFVCSFARSLTAHVYVYVVRTDQGGERCGRCARTRSRSGLQQCRGVQRARHPTDSGCIRGTSG